jgi:hypothetical protein
LFLLVLFLLLSIGEQVRAARLYGLFPQVDKCSLFDSCIGANADPFRAFRGKRIIFASPPALRAR